MKKIGILVLLSAILVVVWCDTNHNFMDVNNPNAKEDLQHYIWSWHLPRLDTDEFLWDDLSWTRNNVKWYANQYYEDNLQEYVDVAKQWLSWTKETLKWYYNSWVDELNGIISDKVNSAISGELNKFKIK